MYQSYPGTPAPITYPGPFPDPSHCATSNCLEYEYRTTNISMYSGVFVDYSGDTFFVDLDFNATKTNQTLSKLEQNKWLDEFTRCALIQWNIYNTWVDSYFIFTVSVEDVGEGILKPTYKFSSVNSSIEGEK